MGFTVYYTAECSLDDQTIAAIHRRSEDLCKNRSWLSCEPVFFFSGSQPLMGGSKPNFMPHPDDVADADALGESDGTLEDLMGVLGKLSSEFNVDWSFSHDHDPGPIGFIRNGIADNALQATIGGITELAKSFPYAGDKTGESLSDADSEDDDGPAILKFPFGD